MKIHLIAATLTTAVLLVTGLAEETKFPPINPALLYWQAAAVLPKLSEEQAGEVRDMATGKKPADAARLAAHGLGAGDGLLRKAAASTAPCDWGLAFEDGPAMAMPHLSKLRELAFIATAKAEAKFAEGKTAEGIDWLLTVHRIARHSGAGDTLISFLVQASIENIAIGSAGRHCLGWDEATRRGYAEKLKALPPLRNLAESYRGEQMFIDWLARLVQSGGPEMEEKLKELFTVEAAGSQEAQKQREAMQQLMTPETSQKEIAALRDFHRRVAIAFDKSWKESAPEIQAMQAEIGQSKSILVKITMPAIVPVWEKAFAFATMHIMLEAALEHGAGVNEAVIVTYEDAFEGKPLRLKRALDGGLSIVAADQHPKGKDVELKLDKK